MFCHDCLFFYFVTKKKRNLSIFKIMIFSWCKANEGSHCWLVSLGASTVEDGTGGWGDFMGYYDGLMHCAIPVKLIAGR